MPEIYINFYISFQNGNIPLMLSVEVGNHGICRELLMVDAKEQLSVRRPDIRDTPLHIASRRKDIELMRLLIEKGAGVNLQNVRIPFGK